MKPIPQVGDDAKVDLEAVPANLRRDAMKHVRVYWKSRLEVNSETSVYIFVKMAELGQEEIPYKMLPVSDKNLNFLGECWLMMQLAHWCG